MWVVALWKMKCWRPWTAVLSESIEPWKSPSNISVLSLPNREVRWSLSETFLWCAVPVWATLAAVLAEMWPLLHLLHLGFLSAHRHGLLCLAFVFFPRGAVSLRYFPSDSIDTGSSPYQDKLGLRLFVRVDKVLGSCPGSLSFCKWRSVWKVRNN